LSVISGELARSAGSYKFYLAAFVTR
jgi:hypothetical protein